MPAVALVTIGLGAALALALVLAVGTVLVQLRRTSAVLDDIDTLVASVPPSLTGLAPALGRITRALG